MSAVRRFGPVSCAVALLALAACSKKVPAPDVPPPTAGHVGAPLTEDECRKFGEELERAISRREVETVGQLMRVGDLIDRCSTQLQLTPDERQKLLAEEAKSARRFADQLVAAVAQGSSYRLLRIREREGRQRALFRVDGAGGGWTYLEVIPMRHADGRVAAGDVYSFHNGELLSETYRRYALLMTAARRAADGAGLTDSERAAVGHADAIRTINDDMARGQFARALESVRRLPEAVRDDRSVFLIGLSAARESSPGEEYLRELERGKRLFANDPALDLMVYTHALLTKKNDTALSALERIDAAIGGDPNLWAEQGELLAEMGRTEDAKRVAERALAAAPDLIPAWLARVTIALKSRDNADVLGALKRAVDANAIVADAAAIGTNADFVEFVKSPQFAEFKKWLAERGKK